MTVAPAAVSFFMLIQLLPTVETITRSSRLLPVHITA